MSHKRGLGFRLADERALAIAIAMLAFVAACGRAERYSPPRPPGLPPDAVYAGGIDGGDWVACEGVQDGALHCRIFDSREGSLRYESWFRYCPQLAGVDAAGEPDSIDWEIGVRLTDVLLRRDRPDIYHPPAGASREQIAMEEEMITKYYHLEGVHADCSPVARD